MKTKEITVRLTKQLEKDMDDLERCVSQCGDTRQKKTLERVSKNLRKHFGISREKHVQRGGMAPIDPATFNLTGLLNTDATPIDAGVAGAGLMNVPAPFYDGNTMIKGSLFSPEVGASFIPSAYAPTISGGASKSKSSKSKSRK
jgi:hypothetical protein